MAFIPAVNCAQVEIRATYFGQQVENTLYFENEASFTTADMIALGEAVSDWWVDEVLTAGLSNQVALREVYVTNLTTVSSPTTTVLLNTGAVGSNSSPGLPGNVSIVISFRTEQRGRSSRGRNYLFGLTESLVAGNQVDVGSLETFRTGYVSLIGAILPAGWTWVVLSRYTNNAPRVTGLMIPITAVVVVDNNVDSQRRRLTGRGN